MRQGPRGIVGSISILFNEFKQRMLTLTVWTAHYFALIDTSAYSVPHAKTRSCTLTVMVSSTYDHRTMNTELPVRSAVLKHCTGGLVVRWVTTSESPLLYVIIFLPTSFLSHTSLTSLCRPIASRSLASFIPPFCYMGQAFMLYPPDLLAKLTTTNFYLKLKRFSIPKK
jgi:hypothetical protein